MRRIQSLFLAWLLVALSGCETAPPEKKDALDPIKMTAFVQHLADSLLAEIGVSFYDLQTGQVFEFNEKQMMHAASTMKVPVMIELFRQAAAGKFSLDDSVTIKNEFRSIVDGSPYSINDDSERSLYNRIGQQATIRELMSLMITWSSNLATNLLIELVQAEKVMATMRELGANDIQVLRGVEDIKAYSKGLNNRTTAHDMMLVLRAIAEHRAATPAACDEMIATLKKQHFTEGIGAGLPAGVEIASKSGAITAIQHDCGIVFPPGRKPYVLIVLTHGIANQADAQHAIAGISRQVYQQLSAEENQATQG